MRQRFPSYASTPAVHNETDQKRSGNSCSPTADAAARLALESIAHRALTDADWERARARLLKFALLLRDWDRQADKTKKCRPDKVVRVGDEPRDTVLGKAA